MSTVATIPEDYKFFDFLAPLRWPEATPEQIACYRELVHDGDLHIETVLENALVVQSQGLYTRVAGIDDFCGGWGDAKKSISTWRMNDTKRGSWTNSAKISNIKNKQGMLRCLVWSRYSDQFYFFAVPNVWYKDLSLVEINMDCARSEPWIKGTLKPQDPIIPQGIPKGKWAKFAVPDFMTLARITEQEVIDRVGLPKTSRKSKKIKD